MSLPERTTEFSSPTNPQPRKYADNPWQTQSVVIRDIKPEVEGVATYSLAFVDQEVQAQYRFVPGQFNMLYLPGAGEIAISISDDRDNTESIAHTIRVAGNVTRLLSHMQVNQTLGLRGPFGTCWPLSECIGRDVILVAGGIGLAPIRPVIYAMLHDRSRYGRLSLLCGAREPETLLYKEEYETWLQSGIDVQTTVDRSSPGWMGNVGVVTLLLERLNDVDPHNTVLLCCGPEVMMKYTVTMARNRGLSLEQIWVSMERNMQCAVGLCGHCQLGPEFICKDGPILRYDRVAPLINTEGL